MRWAGWPPPDEEGETTWQWTNHNNQIGYGRGGREDGGGNSDGGDDYNDDDDNAREQTMPQTERTTGASVHCWLQQQCSSRNDSSTKQSKNDWQQATTTYLLMDGKSATTDAIRSNPVDSTQQSAVRDGGKE